MPETIFSCRLAAVDSWVRTGRRAWTHTCFTSLYRYMQYKCREGLTVALWRGKTSGGWCRAEIVRCEDMVRVVDWGIRNVRLFRQLPDQCLGVTVQAVPLHLAG